MRRKLAETISRTDALPYRIRRSLIKRIDPAMLSDYPFEVGFYGLKFRGNIVNYVDRLVYFCGAHEKYALHFLRDAVRAMRDHGMNSIHFIDVGANTGNHALFMAQLCERVHAFEPFARVRTQLEENIAINKLDNVIVYPFGLGDHDASLPFYAAPDSNLGAASFCAGHRADNTPAGELPIARGDKIFANADAGTALIIKADVEGFEPQVLAGLRETMQARRPLIMVEISQTTRKNLGDAAGFRAAFPDNYSFFCFETAHTGTGKYALTPFDYNAPPPRREDVIACPEEWAGWLPLRGIGTSIPQ